MIDILLPIALFLLMFGLGLTLEFADFALVFSSPKALLAGSGSMLVLVPIAGIVLAQMIDVSPELAFGLFLIATCPGGMFSNMLTKLGGGNLALSISMTAIVSSIYVFTAPIYVALAGEHILGEVTGEVSVPIIDLMAPLIIVLAIPIAAGMAVRHRASGWADRNNGRFRNGSAICLLGVYAILLWTQRADLQDAFAQIAIPVLAMNIGAVAIALGVSFLIRLRSEDRTAIAIEHAIRQEGTAALIAVTILNLPLAALPLILNSLVGLVIGGALLFWERRYRHASISANPHNH